MNVMGDILLQDLPLMAWTEWTTLKCLFLKEDE